MGGRTERLLLDDVAELGYAGIRVDIRGAAGYTSGHDAGDLIVGRAREVIPAPVHPENPDPNDLAETASRLYVIEEKYSSSERKKYIQEQDGEKLDAMTEFAESIGAVPLLAARWSTEVEWSPGAEHLIADLREVERTDSNSLSLKPETAAEEFETVEEFFG